MRVLITRPLGDAEPLAEAVRARGHEPIVQPLTEIRFERPEPPPERPAATIFTSRNALRGLGGVDWAAVLHDLPAYCVGTATARAARDTGFRHVIAGGGTGAQLLEYVAHVHRPEDGSLLYVTGDHLAFDMQAALGTRGFTLWRRIVYRSVLIPSLDPSVAEDLRAGRIHAVMLMSPRAAAHFVDLAREQGLAAHAADLIYYCLSKQVAAPLVSLGAERIHVAPNPTKEDLLNLLEVSGTA
jgi:uroporphyrinogen-III synthase